MSRELMLVGSVPLKPAMSVYKCACQHGLTQFMPRIPDGEQNGWALGLLSAWGGHPALEPHGEPLKLTLRPSTFFGSFAFSRMRLKAGHSIDELLPGGLGIAEGFQKSYLEFTEAKAQGILPKTARFTATLPGPGTSMPVLDIPHSELFPYCSRVFRREIAKILDFIPAEELTIQVDMAGEVELEEYRRRPQAYEMPVFAETEKNWPFKETVAMISEIADAVPETAELGFHLCAIYHIDESQGQDLNVHVDFSNALANTVRRHINYIHMPTTPDYETADFEPLRALRLDPRTKIYLGLIHVEDGVKGAVRRARAAAEVRSDFGVAAFCGLAQPSRAEFANPHTIDNIFEIHREVAEAT